MEYTLNKVNCPCCGNEAAKIGEERKEDDNIIWHLIWCVHCNEVILQKLVFVYDDKPIKSGTPILDIYKGNEILSITASLGDNEEKYVDLLDRLKKWKQMKMGISPEQITAYLTKEHI